jgi:hypothetical protein
MMMIPPIVGVPDFCICPSKAQVTHGFANLFKAQVIYQPAAINRCNQ